MNEENEKKDLNENLDEMMKSASEKVDYNDNNNKGNKKGKSTKKVIIFTVIGLLLFGAVLATGAFMMNENDEFVDKSEDPDWVDKDNVATEVDDDDEFLDEWNFERPIEVSDWAMNPFVQSEFWEEEGIEDKILEKSREELQGFYSSVSWISSGIPSGYDDPGIAGPYTNNIEERFLEDESENPEFSYALSEDYQKAYVVYTERLLNPSFGGWAVVQSSDLVSVKDNRIYNQLRDMFSNEWWDNNVKESEDYTGLPIITEWTNGDWDKYDLAEREANRYGVFYGVIDDNEDRYVTSENIGSDEENQPIMQVSSPVKYYAFGKDKKLVEISGTLELTLQSNSDTLNVENRVIISDAKLTLE